MSKKTREKLVKGTKLAAQPLNDLLKIEVVDTGLNVGNVDDANLENYETSFRTNFWLSSITSYRAPDPSADPAVTVDSGENINQAYCFPFILAPPQDTFSTNINSDSKYYTLRDMSFSWDQGDEPISWVAYINENPAGTVDDRFYNFGTTEVEAGKFDFKLSLWCKTPTYVNPNVTHWEQEIGSWTIPGAAFIADNMAFNPYTIDDIDVVLAPDKIYCLTLEYLGQEIDRVGESTGTGKKVFFPNIQVSLRYTTPLRTFTYETSDASPLFVQNIPANYKGNLADNIVQNAVGAGDSITEASIQPNIEAIDSRFQHKLQGGHNTLWSKPQAATQSKLTAYDIFTVNLFNNINNYTYGAYDLSEVPYTKTTGPVVIVPSDTFDSIADRRVVPIHYPYIIEAIYVCWQHKDAASNPTQTTDSHEKTVPLAVAATGTYHFEVVLHTASRSDTYGTQTIAYWTGNPVTTTDLIDTAVDPFTQRVDHPSAASYLGFPSIFTLPIPLNYRAAGTQLGRGYNTTGIPIYVGRGLGDDSDNRTNMALGVNSGAAAGLGFNKGVEKLLEFKIKVSGVNYAVAGEDDRALWADGPNAPGFTYIVVCKKMLTKSEW
jgi:hypothetical protein